MLPFEYSIQVRVRYAETDQMGVVWHGNYFKYFEDARTEALRHCGWAYRDIEQAGIMLPLAEAYIAFRQPAKYDDLLTVKVVVKEPPTVRLRFDYEVANEAGEVLVTGYTVLAITDAVTRRPRRPPDWLKAIFA